MSDLSIRTISAEQHAAYLAAQPSASFLQTPGWAAVKSEWKAESLGWFDPAAPNDLLGVALVLYRQMPKVKRYLAYLPEGPVIDWDAIDLGRYLRPLAAHCQEQGAFGLRMGPPVPMRRWHAQTIKDAIAGGQQPKLGDVRPDVIEPSGATVAAQLRALGWKAPRAVEGFAAGQPQYVFQVPLAGKTEADLLTGMNQQWRRNIKKSAKLGVEVTLGTPEDLKAFHALYVETAERDHFTPGRCRTSRRCTRRCRPSRPTAVTSGSTTPTTRAIWSHRRSGSGWAVIPGTPTVPARPRSETSVDRTRSSGE